MADKNPPPDIPPRWVLAAIERVHPLARLGWDGGPDFAVLELWRVREAPETLAGGGEAYRGHVYGSPYDPLGQVPLHIMDASVYQVFGGSVIDMVKHASTSFSERARARRRQEANAVNDQIEGMAKEWGDRYWHELQTGNIRDPATSKKFVSAEEKYIASGEWFAEQREHDLNAAEPDPNARPIK